MKGLLSIWLILLSFARAALADDVTIAVASNFLPIAEQIAADFERETGHTVTISHGSTGQLFALISNGAPFDVFLAADRERPAALLESGLASEVRTYALGRLFLVSRKKVLIRDAPEAFIGANVALADPILAPYGLASTAAMEGLGVDTATFQPLPVANVAQAATLFATGNADIAFVAASLLPLLDSPYQLSLEGLHPPIRQDAAFLSTSEDSIAAVAFWAYLLSEKARPRILAGGYALP